MAIKHYNATSDKRSLLQCIKFKAYAIFVNAYQWFPILLHSIFAKRRQYKYTVSLCLIFKDEAKYLQEWIEYHMLIGVEHFYLYNNFSSDNYKEVLAPYINKGIVTLTEFPYKHGQAKAYTDCYNRFKDESHWIGYIDTDEFINLIAYNDIKQLLHHFRNMPSLYLNWKIFGTSGHLDEDKSLVTERYTASWPWLCNIGKSFINNDYSFKQVDIHFHFAKYLGFKLHPVNLNRVAVPYCESLFSFKFENRAYLNHYWSKSYEQYINKDMIRGSAVSETNSLIRRRSDRFPCHELYNRERDYSIQRWLTFLKLRLREEK